MFNVVGADVVLHLVGMRDPDVDANPVVGADVVSHSVII
jgi:hypothetical protein